VLLHFCGAVINHDYFIKGGPTHQVNDITFGSSLNVSGAAVDSGISRGMVSDSVTNDCYFSSVTTNSDSSDLPQDKGATVEGSESSQSFSTTSEYFKLGGSPTIVCISLVGPNFKEKKVEVQWGVFVGSSKEPAATFKVQKHAHLFAGNPSFDSGNDIITVKKV